MNGLPTPFSLMKIFTMDPENLYLKEKTFQLQSSEFSRTLE